jgi:predicted metalloprotease
MNLNGRRKSSNVVDRRSVKGKAAGGIGIGAVVIAIVVALLGGDPSEVMQQLSSTSTESSTNYQPTEQEKAFEVFASQILASTEDVWTAVFKKMGRTYKAPTLVLFHGSVQSGCGGATSSTGPFYCSADECLYLDLDFFDEMSKKMGAGGDFAHAYVIAHEVGHHVQHLLGTLDQAHAQMSRASEKERNNISVRIELQADYYAGVWGHYESKLFGSLEPGDLEEALNAAQRIGDDYLQKQSRGYAVPDSFTHGTSAQRMRWLKKGLSTGDMKGGDTFSPRYNSL